MGPTRGSVPYLRRRAPHHCGDPDPSRTIGLTSVVSSSPWLSTFLESEQTWCPRQAFGLRPNDQSCHHETWLHLHFVDWNNKWNHQAHYNGNIRLKERPASSGYGAQKRNISEVLSDDSLSSRVHNHWRSLVLAISLAHHHEVT